MSRPERTTETGLSAAEKKMFALLGQTGRGGKDAALAFISGKTGRDITSRTDLTPSELSTVIKALEAELEGANA